MTALLFLFFTLIMLGLTGIGLLMAAFDSMPANEGDGKAGFAIVGVLIVLWGLLIWQAAVHLF